jgi:hypothetical protein
VERLALTIGPAIAAVALLWIARNTVADLRIALQSGSTRATQRNPSIDRVTQPGLFWNYLVWTGILLAVQAVLTLAALAIMTNAMLNGDNA